MKTKVTETTVTIKFYGSTNAGSSFLHDLYLTKPNEPELWIIPVSKGSIEGETAICRYGDGSLNVRSEFVRHVVINGGHTIREPMEIPKDMIELIRGGGYEVRSVLG